MAHWVKVLYLELKSYFFNHRFFLDRVQERGYQFPNEVYFCVAKQPFKKQRGGVKSHPGI